MEKIPEEFQDFVKEKQIQLLNNVLTSSVAGIVVSNIVSVFYEDFTGDIIIETLKAQIPILALIVVASVLTLAFREE